MRWWIPSLIDQSKYTATLKRLGDVIQFCYSETQYTYQNEFSSTKELCPHLDVGYDLFLINHGRVADTDKTQQYVCTHQVVQKTVLAHFLTKYEKNKG